MHRREPLCKGLRSVLTSFRELSHGTRGKKAMKLIVSHAARGDEGLLGKLFVRRATIGMVLGACLFAGTVWAQQQPRVLDSGMRYKIFGSGNQSCGS